MLNSFFLKFIFHRDLYDVNIHVPLVFIHPSLKPQRVKEPVSLLDIMPTILSMVKIPVPQNSEGQDIAPLLLGKNQNIERGIFSERPPFDEYSVRKGHWKYILRNPEKKNIGLSDSYFFADLLPSESNFKDELYDLSADPYEQKNLLGKGLKEEEELRKEVLAFREKMRRARESNKEIKIIDKTKLLPYP